MNGRTGIFTVHQHRSDSRNDSENLASHTHAAIDEYSNQSTGFPPPYWEAVTDGNIYGPPRYSSRRSSQVQEENINALPRYSITAGSITGSSKRSSRVQEGNINDPPRNSITVSNITDSFRRSSRVQEGNSNSPPRYSITAGSSRLSSRAHVGTFADDRPVNEDADRCPEVGTFRLTSNERHSGIVRTCINGPRQYCPPDRNRSTSRISSRQLSAVTLETLAAVEVPSINIQQCPMTRANYTRRTLVSLAQTDARRKERYRRCLLTLWIFSIPFFLAAILPFVLQCYFLTAAGEAIEEQKYGRAAAPMTAATILILLGYGALCFIIIYFSR